MGANPVSRLVIRNGTLIDGSGRAPQANDAIVIEDGRIVGVGRESAGAAEGAGGAATVIDASGSFILPGLIDGHCHLSLHQAAMPGIRYPSSAEFSTIWAIRAATRALRAGVTGVSVPGGKWYVDPAVRDAVSAGLVEGPRIFCGARGLTPYGGIFDQEPAWQETPPHSSGVRCNGVDEFVAETRRQCKHGVNLIKLADADWGQVQTMSEQEVAAVVTEAHRRGVRVAIHARGSGAVRAAALGGVDWIFHADLATDEDLDLVAERRIPIMPVLTSVFLGIERGREVGVDDAMRDTLKHQMDLAVEMVVKARKRGITILSGTDSGNAYAFEHGAYHAMEAQLLAQHAGFTPMEAIVSMTRDNAMTIGLEGQVGVIAPGMLADLIVCRADPLRDLAVLRDRGNLAAVVKAGRPVALDTEPFGALPTEPRRAGSSAFGW
ncbi:MAG: amidohydrolase family protein [Lautropia sp.]